MRDLLIIVVVALAMLAIKMASPARGHDWYPAECCSGQDCRRLEDAEVAQYVRPTRNGRWYIVGWDIVVDMKDWSPDGKFHLCEAPHKFYCLYVPRVSGL